MRYSDMLRLGICTSCLGKGTKSEPLGCQSARIVNCEVCGGTGTKEKNDGDKM